MVIQNEVPVKGLKLLSDGRTMILGLENGEIKVADRVRFTVFTSNRLVEASVLKIDQVLEAVLI